MEPRQTNILFLGWLVFTGTIVGSLTIAKLRALRLEAKEQLDCNTVEGVFIDGFKGTKHCIKEEP
jgi:hypothetical protein